MTETKIELSGSCRFTLTTYENSDRKDMSLDYTEHSTDHWNSDTETSIDIDADKAREIVAFMHKAFPEIAQQEPVATYRGSNDFGHDVIEFEKSLPIGAKLYTSPSQPASAPAPAPAAKPVGPPNLALKGSSDLSKPSADPTPSKSPTQ